MTLWKLSFLNTSTHSRQQPGRTRRQHIQLRTEFNAQGKKLLDAHCAGAIPIGLVKIEQERIASQLSRIEHQLSAADANFQEARQLLADTLDLTRDCHAAYMEADDNMRRLFKQAFFSKIYIDEDEAIHERSVKVDYNQPFDDLLSRLVPAHVHRSLEANNRSAKQTSRPDTRTGGDAISRGSVEGQGCPQSTLVELRGIEPRSSGVDPGLLRVQSAMACSQPRRSY